jgi:hypothetical protein
VRYIPVAVSAAAILAAAACSSQATASPAAAHVVAPAASPSHAAVPTPKPSAAPSATPTATASAKSGGTVVPVLHLGGSVTFSDPQPGPAAGSTVSEKQTWKLTSASYLTYAQAREGGTYGDVAAQLGANELQTGYRYLVAGLTITDDGPHGFGTSGLSFTLTNADYEWAQKNNDTGTTAPFCVDDVPSDGESTIVSPYVSDLCDVQQMTPGQHASGFVFFAVPDAAAAIGVVETEPEKVLALIDPENVCDEAGSGC